MAPPRRTGGEARLSRLLMGRFASWPGQHPLALLALADRPRIHDAMALPCPAAGAAQTPRELIGARVAADEPGDRIRVEPLPMAAGEAERPDLPPLAAGLLKGEGPHQNK